MRIPIGRLALCAALGLSAGTANAAVTLILGTNQLKDHINGVANATPSFTVFGTTKDEGASISFTGNTALDITNGFAQISDATPGVNPFTNLSISLTKPISPTNVVGFTAYEFSVQYNAPAATGHNNTTPFAALLTIGYDLVGGGTGTFTYLACDPAKPAACDAARQDLKITNSNTQDFQLQATGNDVFSHIYLLSDQPIFQVKQNEIKLTTARVAAVPEPSSWAMMLLGFGLVGAGYRRRPARKLAIA